MASWSAISTAAVLARSGDWEAAYSVMLEADHSGAIVEGDNLSDYATAAYMTGREDVYRDLMTRAFDAYADAGALLDAARTAFWIGLTLMFKGEHGRGGGWLARAGHLVEGFCQSNRPDSPFPAPSVFRWAQLINL